jgi:hypothetical protein
LTQTNNTTSNIHETGEWPKDFNESAMTALNGEPKATKCSNNLTVSHIAYAAKTVAIKHRGNCSNIVQYKYGFRRERGTTDKVVMQRTLPEQFLDVEEVCTCFIYRVRHKSANTPLSHERLVVRNWLAVYSVWG